MTKKDYILIANVFKKQKRNIGETIAHIQSAKKLYGRFLKGFMNMLEADNSRFDRQKFIDYIAS